MSKVSAFLLPATLLITYLVAQDTKPEAFSAVAMVTGGPAAASTVPFNFQIKRYTTDEEVKQLATLLREKGQDALRREMEKLNVGRIAAVGGTGNTIAVARRRQVGADTVLTIVTARYMSFAERRQSGRSTDYPFGFVQLKLNEKGEGSGQIMAAAKIRFNEKKGHYEIESFGNQYIKAANVRPRT
jgi:hypothetical protein